MGNFRIKANVLEHHWILLLQSSRKQTIKVKEKEFHKQTGTTLLLIPCSFRECFKNKQSLSE